MSTKKKSNKQPSIKGVGYTFGLQDRPAEEVLAALIIYKEYLLRDTLQCIGDNQVYPLEGIAKKLAIVEEEIGLLESQVIQEEAKIGGTD